MSEDNSLWAFTFNFCALFHGGIFFQSLRADSTDDKKDEDVNFRSNDKDNTHRKWRWYAKMIKMIRKDDTAKIHGWSEDKQRWSRWYATRPSWTIRCDVWIVKRMRYPTNQPTDRPTDQLTDTAGYRGVLSHLKMIKMIRKNDQYDT